MYAQNKGDSKYMKQKLVELTEEETNPQVSWGLQCSTLSDW